jgi:hypothetical protein
MRLSKASDMPTRRCFTTHLLFLEQHPGMTSLYRASIRIYCHPWRHRAQVPCPHAIFDTAYDLCLPFALAHRRAFFVHSDLPPIHLFPSFPFPASGFLSLFPPFSISRCPAFCASIFSVCPTSPAPALCLILFCVMMEVFLGLMTRVPRWYFASGLDGDVSSVREVEEVRLSCRGRDVRKRR